MLNRLPFSVKGNVFTGRFNVKTPVLGSNAKPFAKESSSSNRKGPVTLCTVKLPIAVFGVVLFGSADSLKVIDAGRVLFRRMGTRKVC